MRKAVLSALWVFAGYGSLQAASIKFTARELFRIPFGTTAGALGAKIEGGNFIIPRDFTMDESGRFYIYDANNHRIVRYSSAGQYEIAFRYGATAHHIFAHADSHDNLWLLISDPVRGIYYGIYDSRGHLMKSGVFSQFNHFQLHPSDDSTLEIILSSQKDPNRMQTYIFDEGRLLMKKLNIARPPDTHHQIRKSDHTYFIDQMPDSSDDDAHRVSRVTDETHHDVADIQGSVIYMTDRGEVYTRLGERDVHVYDIDGSLKATVHLTGLASACAAIRFDSYGNIYELDGTPDADGTYSAKMPGMRLLQWERIEK